MSSILAISLPMPIFNGCGLLSENAAGNRSYNVAMRSCEAFDISKTAPPPRPLPPRDLAHADVGWENADTSGQITDAGQDRDASGGGLQSSPRRIGPRSIERPSIDARPLLRS